MSDAAETTAIQPKRTFDLAVAFPPILDRLAKGESLRQICRDDGMPAVTTVMDWVQRPEWSEHYARAREAGWSLVGEEMLEIADDSTNDWMDRETESGRKERVVDREAIERTRLRLDTRKWMLTKMLPKVYGDRITVDGQLVLIAFSKLSTAARDDAAGEP